MILPNIRRPKKPPPQRQRAPSGDRFDWRPGERVEGPPRKWAQSALRAPVSRSRHEGEARS